MTPMAVDRQLIHNSHNEPAADFAARGALDVPRQPREFKFATGSSPSRRLTRDHSPDRRPHKTATEIPR